MFHSDNAYFLPERRINSRRVKTNTVSNTAFRGFGGPQGMMAIERVIDAIAWKLGLDPLDVRKANLYGPGRDVTPYGQTVEDHDIAPRLIEQLERSSRLPAAAQRDRGVQRPLADPETRDRADAGEVRHLVHAHRTSIRPARWCMSIRTDRSTSIMAALRWARACFRKSRRWRPKSSASGLIAYTSPRLRPTRCRTRRRRRRRPAPI